MEGGCACGEIRYRLESRPLFIHCCHCRSCQRETGTAFALNALIETSRVRLLQGTPHTVHTPSDSGKGQDIVRCPVCQVAIWSHYAGAGSAIAFVRVGTLDEASGFEPDIHIYTASKQEWVLIPEDQPAVAQYYSPKDFWPAESLARWQALRQGTASD